MALACGRGTALQGGFDRPDIVLVSIDSLRRDHVGAYGYPKPTTPTIDRLAREGVRFENALSTTSWTLPAHAALFTGLYDSTHGVVFDNRRLGEDHVTLAELFKAAGYQTAGFFGGPYLHPTFGMAQGFDVYRSCMTKIPDDLPDSHVRTQARGGRHTAHLDVTGPRTLRELQRWIDQDLSEEPFFVFLHLWDVHYEFIPPAEYAAMFDPNWSGGTRFDGFVRNPTIHPDMPERDYAHLLALYDGEIRFTDDNLGRMLALLDQRGRLEGAVVVVTADHGEEFLEHGNKGHRRTLFDEVIRVPLVVRLPEGEAGGRVVRDQVSLIDLLPTLLSLAGIPLDFPVQGRDLVPLMAGAELPQVEHMTELRKRSSHLRALRSAEHKFIADGKGFARYYDLRRDPGEREPLARTFEGYREAKQRLKAAANEALAFREQLGDRTPRDLRLDPELRRRLEMLGYLEPAPEPEFRPGGGSPPLDGG